MSIDRLIESGPSTAIGAAQRRRGSNGFDAPPRRARRPARYRSSWSTRRSWPTWSASISTAASSPPPNRRAATARRRGRRPRRDDSSCSKDSTTPRTSGAIARAARAFGIDGTRASTRPAPTRTVAARFGSAWARCCTADRSSRCDRLARSARHLAPPRFRDVGDDTRRRRGRPVGHRRHAHRNGLRCCSAPRARDSIRAHDARSLAPRPDPDLDRPVDSLNVGHAAAITFAALARAWLTAARHAGGRSRSITGRMAGARTTAGPSCVTDPEPFAGPDHPIRKITRIMAFGGSGRRHDANRSRPLRWDGCRLVGEARRSRPSGRRSKTD